MPKYTLSQSLVYLNSPKLRQRFYVIVGASIIVTV